MEKLIGSDDRCFASITEFSIAAQDIGDALKRFEKRRRHIEVVDLRRLGLDREGLESVRSPDYEHFYILTFGVTDIVEITHFNQIYHLFGVAESDAHSSRKSIGTRCIAERELRRMTDGHPSEKFGLLPGLFRSDPRRPFLAISCLRLSTGLRLFVHSRDPRKETLLGRFLEALLKADFPMWSDYRRVLTSTAGMEEPPAMVLTPLLGLDSVDVVLVYRAARLEQIAALTWAARHQKFESFVGTEGKEENAEDYVHNAFLHLHVDKSSILREWNSAALFKEVRTVWGMPIHLDRSSGMWRVESGGGSEQLAAKAAVVFAMKKAAPDRFRKSLEPFGIVDSGRGVEEEAEPGLQGKELVDGRRREEDVLMLFGRADSLALGEGRDRLRQLTVAEVRRHFEYLTGFGTEEEGLKAGIWPDTEVAVRLRIPPDYDLPTYDFMKRFRNLLRDKNLHDFDRTAKEVSWTLQWLDGSKAIGTSYGTTNVLVNVIRSIMGYLERDPEGFSDLLPLLRRIIDIVKNRNPTQREVTWLVTRFRSLFVNFARQYYPLQSPYASSIFEGNTGYRRAYDAFVAFSRAMLKDVSPGCSIMVLESTGGGLSCELGPYGFIILRVSPFVIHYPIAWLVTPEFAHARIAKSSFRELDEVGVAHQIEALGGELGDVVISPEDTVGRILSRFGELLEWETGESLGRVFVMLFRSILREILTDVTLWGSLRLENEPPLETNRRFWFVHGPGIAAAVFRIAGGSPPSLDIVMGIMLRFFFLNYVLWFSFERMEEHGDEEEDWSDLFEKLLGRLSEGVGQVKFQLEEFEGNYGEDHLERSYVHLNCMRLDLGCPEGKWLTAIEILRRSIELLTEEVRRSVGKWISAIQPLVDLWLVRGATPDRRLVQDAYAEYLSVLVEAWETSDPWPPFIDHREVKTSVEGGGVRNSLVDRSRICGSDPRGGFLPVRGGVFVRDEGGTLEGQKAYHRATGELMGLLEDLSRKFRADELRHFLQVEL